MVSTVTGRQGLIPTAGVKAPCVAASTSNITLSGEQTIDSRAVVSGDRVLVTGQTDTSENGVYAVGDSTWSRTSDLNDNVEFKSGVIVPVHNPSGTSAVYQLTAPAGAFVLGTTAITANVLGDIQVLDDDTMAANSSTATISQQSLIVYVASQLAAQLLDEDDMASNSATKASTQQALKAYVDSVIYSLPSQAAAANKILTSNGTVGSWKDLSEFAVQFCSVGVTEDDSIAASATELITPARLESISDTSGLESSGVITAPFPGVCLAFAGLLNSGTASNSGAIMNLRVEGSYRKDFAGGQSTAPGIGAFTPGVDMFRVSLDDEIEPGVTNLETDAAITILGDAAKNESFFVFMFIRGGSF